MDQLGRSILVEAFPMGMSGVVVWYSREKFCAIIWCEDSKELGIASGPTAWRNPMVDVSVGDCVAFQIQMRGAERFCRDIRLLECQAAPALPAYMTSQAKSEPLSRFPPLHLCSSRD
jgi:hypothetical protein